tara:strand:- start:15265 stop:16062 length:798 start_codon:yes stop_codon:yes gene_type:complete
MNRLVLQFAAIASLAFSFSCEKVIDIPLNEADQAIVVEAVGRNFVGESFIVLSKTGSVYDDSGFETLTDAAVTVTDQDGIATIFNHDPLNPGRYIAPTFAATPNSAYDLNIVTDDLTFSASSTTNSIPELDSLNYILVPPGFGSKDTTFLLFYNFVDNVTETNFYRIKALVNGKADNNYYIGDDVLGNGQATSAPIFGTEIKSKDTVHIELLSMDEDTYTYLSTLNSNINSGPFGATPANPVTNIDNAIGYFGVYMVDTMSIIMP